MSEITLFPNEPMRFTIREMDQVLVHYARLAASDITIQVGEQILVEVHGRLYKVTRRALTANEVGDVLNAIYGANGTAQLLSGQDIDTHYEIRPARDERFRFRINGTACQVEGHTGLQITARTIPTDPPYLKDMQLPGELLKALAPDQGVVYVTGATGSGKSTLLAAIIRELAEQAEGHRKILTYESPIEFVYDNVNTPSTVISQSEIPKHLPSFAAGVRNALRRKPRLILVGEARDQDTINAVMDAAMTGHPVYTTLHSNGVAETVRRLVNSFPREERAAKTLDIFESIRVVIWQRLVPSPDGRRVALREYLVFNEEIRDILLESDIDKVTVITKQLLRQHGKTMLTDAEEKFNQGQISERVFKLIEESYKKINA